MRVVLMRISRVPEPRMTSGQQACKTPYEVPGTATTSMETVTAARGEWLALCALLLPWATLSLLLPLAHLAVSMALLLALAMLLFAAVTWSRQRAEVLRLDPQAWGLAAVLSLGFAMALLIGTEGKSGFDALCHDCGRLQDAREPFCHTCGAYA